MQERSDEQLMTAVMAGDQVAFAKQRIGIAQALLNDPELLIVDEPTGLPAGDGQASNLGLTGVKLPPQESSGLNHRSPYGSAFLASPPA